MSVFLSLDGRILPLESYGARRAELMNLTPGAWRDRLMRSSAELLACIDLESRESEAVAAVLTSENARLGDELLMLRDTVARREGEAKTAQAALDVACSEHARSKLEAETAYRRLEEEHISLKESLNAAQGDIAKLKDSLVGADQALKEQEDMVQKAKADAETEVRRAREDLRGIRVAW